MIHDAIVVGAGLSGLVCARRLTAAGVDAIVIEARDRVGGRLHTGRLAGEVIDLGGQWISSGQPRVVALAAELGAATFRHVREGQARFVEEPRGLFAELVTAIATWRAVRRIRRTSRGLDRAAGGHRETHAALDTHHALDADAALGTRAAIDANARGLDPAAAALDRETLADWLARTIPNRVARDRIALHAELVFAAAPADISVLHYLSRLATTGDFAPTGPELPGGGREHRFTDGAQTLALRLADLLGHRVTLSAPIVAIEQTDDQVVARTASQTYTARRLVLAVPPALACTIPIAFAPAAPVPVIAIDLPPATRALVEATRTGPVVKCFAAYDRAFWRDDGSSGEIYQARGTVRATVELITPGGVPALLAFVVGPAAVGWAQRDLAERRAEILATLVEQFGPAAGSPIDYVDVDWGAGPWSAGCVANVGPGVLSAGATWREAHGRIHIAGTESASAWPGYMEGAIEAGERAAAEVLAALHR